MRTKTGHTMLKMDLKALNSFSWLTVYIYANTAQYMAGFLIARTPCWLKFFFFLRTFRCFFPQSYFLVSGCLTCATAGCYFETDFPFTTAKFQEVCQALFSSLLCSPWTATLISRRVKHSATFGVTCKDTRGLFHPTDHIINTDVEHHQHQTAWLPVHFARCHRLAVQLWNTSAKKNVSP